MNGRRMIRTIVTVAGAGLLASTSAGCELLVQLDRSQVDSGGESGCAICSPAVEAGDDSRAEAAGEPGDASAGTEATTPDASTETSTTDSGADAGG